MTGSFVHLHVHTEYSVLDGAARVPDLVAECARLGMPAVAITDHGVLHGAHEFHRAAVAAGITPVVGLEAFVAPTSGVEVDRAGAHLTLWARDARGLRNLLALSSAGVGRLPRVDVEVVAAHSAGVMGTTGCASGEVASLLRAGREREALDVAALWRDVFGADDFFVELVDHGVPGERVVRDGLLRVAAKLGAPVVVTNDVHHVRASDAAVQDALLSLGSGKTVRDPSRFRLGGSGHHLRSAEEMYALDSSDAWQEGCRRTLAVAERVDPAGMFARGGPGPSVVDDVVAWAAGSGVLVGEGLEVDERRREDVLRHLGERWGWDRVARVGAFARIRGSARLPHPDLEGLVRDVGVDPVAVVVAGEALVERVPLWTRPGDGALVTQFDREACEALGFSVVDLVGSAEVALVADLLRNVVLNGKPAVDLGGVPRASWLGHLAECYPAEHLAAVVTAEPASAAGAGVLPPDVNLSRRDFTAVGSDVRYGLGAVRFVADEVVDAIVRAREERGRFADFFDFLRKVDLGVCDRKAVEALVKAGAFDSLGHPRKGLHLVHGRAFDAVVAASLAEEGGQLGLFGGEEFDVVVPDESWTQDERLTAEREVLSF
ncbi:PHP domain-containing protein [Umezawaea endophytica]|uniref:DNA-directed DNA polymerase n=1 Tax=Umezawaea endophytica TaxID=1654476 RepID=A0A9X2VN67_9PSEU|nr:PHP domain-containing protein [Umezawaea endophytica]MCS7478328.1 PHP domain-containing protein [Umezawaea endophytica]